MLLKVERISWLQGFRMQASSHPDSKRLGVQSPSVQQSRVQASSCPESKSPVVQSPRVQWSRVQVPSRPESKSPEPKCSESKRPDHTPRVQLFRYAFLNVVIQSSVLFIATGFVTMFCNNVETSLSCLFIQLTN